MKKKKVWQYECEFCKKKRYTPHSMRVHEDYCTMNPNRACRMCDREQYDDGEIKALGKYIPIPIVDKNSSEVWKKIVNLEEINTAIKNLLADIICPACVFSVIRQLSLSKIATEFDYTEEVRIYWESVNEQNLPY